jgi:hypothetical protein
MLRIVSHSSQPRWGWLAGISCSVFDGVCHTLCVDINSVDQEDACKSYQYNPLKLKSHNGALLCSCLFGLVGVWTVLAHC